MAFLKRLLRSLPLLVVSPLLMAISILALAVTDLLWKLWPIRWQSPQSPNSEFGGYGDSHRITGEFGGYGDSHRISVPGLAAGVRGPTTVYPDTGGKTAGA